MKNLFIGIDNGKQGAVAIIDEDKNILNVLKYDEKDPLCFYTFIKQYCDDSTEIRAFIEKPIVVYGLAHQTSPFETIGRHKMALEILGIPYMIGDPLSGSASNWKRIIGLFEKANSAAKENTKEISAINKRVRELKIQAEFLGFSERELKEEKLAYMNKNIVGLAEEYRTLKKEISKLKRDKKQNVKQTSVDACLSMFKDAEKFISKSSKSSKTKYDDDIAEALLLAECGRTLYEQKQF